MEDQKPEQPSEAANEDWRANAHGLPLVLDDGENAIIIWGPPVTRRRPGAEGDEPPCQAFPATANGEYGALYVRSKRLLHLLAMVPKLYAQRLVVTRSGKGVKTTYAVQTTGQYLEPESSKVLSLETFGQ